MSDREVSEAAGKAADYLEKNGWVQNRAFDSTGSACLVGAMVNVAGLTGELVKRLRVAVADVIGEEDRWLVVWNDASYRTKDEVIGVLREVEIKYAPDSVLETSC